MGILFCFAASMTSDILSLDPILPGLILKQCAIIFASKALCNGNVYQLLKVSSYENNRF